MRSRRALIAATMKPIGTAVCRGSGGSGVQMSPTLSPSSQTTPRRPPPGPATHPSPPSHGCPKDNSPVDIPDNTAFVPSSKA